MTERTVTTRYGNVSLGRDHLRYDAACAFRACRLQDRIPNVNFGRHAELSLAQEG